MCLMISCPDMWAVITHPVFPLRCFQTFLVVCSPLQVSICERLHHLMGAVGDISFILILYTEVHSPESTVSATSCRCLPLTTSTSVCTWRTRHVCGTPWAGRTTDSTSCTAEPAANTSRFWESGSVPMETMGTNMVSLSHLLQRREHRVSFYHMQLRKTDMKVFEENASG